MEQDTRDFFKQLQKRVFKTEDCSIIDIRAICWEAPDGEGTITGTGYAVYRVSDTSTTLLRIETANGVVIEGASLIDCVV